MIDIENSFGFLTDISNCMKIVGVAVNKVYRFNCPNCGSRLEAESYEFLDIGGKVKKFYCPVCNEDRYISWSNIRKKIIYASKDDSQK